MRLEAVVLAGSLVIATAGYYTRNLVSPQFSNTNFSNSLKVTEKIYEGSFSLPASSYNFSVEKEQFETMSQYRVQLGGVVAANNTTEEISISAQLRNSEHSMSRAGGLESGVFADMVLGARVGSKNENQMCEVGYFEKEGSALGPIPVCSQSTIARTYALLQETLRHVPDGAWK